MCVLLTENRFREEVGGARRGERKEKFCGSSSRASVAWPTTERQTEAIYSPRGEKCYNIAFSVFFISKQQQEGDSWKRAPEGWKTDHSRRGGR